MLTGVQVKETLGLANDGGKGAEAANGDFFLSLDLRAQVFDDGGQPRVSHLDADVMGLGKRANELVS